MLFKMMHDHKFTNRISRKPMPQELKEKMAKQCKEYNEYKMAEKLLLDKEENAQLNHHIATMDSLVFLPDYLFDEVTVEGGEAAEDDDYEFTPAMLYTEQLMRMYPREMSARLKLMPAVEEHFMREEDTRNEEQG